MNASKLLKQFLSTGNKPANQREASALLDESRSLLVSKLSTTALDIQNMAVSDIDDVLRGTEGTVLERAVACHRASQKTAPKKDRLGELVQLINEQKKVIAAARQKTAAPFKPTASAAKIPRQLQDKRQAPLPLASWNFGHLAIEAENGNPAALAELESRGFARTGQNTFNRKA